MRERWVFDQIDEFRRASDALTLGPVIAALVLLSVLAGCVRTPSSGGSLEAPYDLVAQPSEQGVELSWKSQASSDAHFNIYRSDTSSVMRSADHLVEGGVTTLTYLDGSAVDIGTVYYAVSESDGTNASNLSNVVGVTTYAQSPVVPTFTDIEWSRISNAPVGRLEAQGGVVDGALYVFGGFVSFTPYRTTTASHRYDPDTDVWTQLADMPEPWTHGSMAVDGKNLYLAGAWKNPNDRDYSESDTIVDGEATVLRYDIASDSWHTDVPPLPEARGAGALKRVGRNLHFFGGHEARTGGPETHVESPSHWSLSLDDPASGWVSRADLPNPRNHLGSAVLDGAIYAIGGQYLYDEHSEAQADVHRYDPGTDTWTAVADLPFPLSHTTSASFVVGDRIIVLGGEIVHNGWVGTALAYDPTDDSWTRLTDLPTEKNAGVGGEIDGRLYFSGGGGLSVVTYEGIPIP